MDLPPGKGIPLHSHPYAEVFYVVMGHTDFLRVDEQGQKEWVRCGPGDTLVAPMNALHAFPAVWTFAGASRHCSWQYGASGGGGLNHGWVADNVGRGALGEGFSFNLLTEQRYQILAGGTPSAQAPLR